jgi:hypothetical protein
MIKVDLGKAANGRTTAYPPMLSGLVQPIPPTRT